MSNCHCDDHCSVGTFLSSLSFLQQQNNGKNLPNNNTPNKVPKYKQQWQTLSSTTTIQQQTNKQKDGRTKKRSKETMNDEPNLIQFHHDEKHSLFTEFNFHEYGKNGDAIYVHKSKRDNTYYTYLCDKAHFLIDDPELFVEVKEYNQKNPVLMVKESKIFTTPTIAYDRLILLLA